MAQWVAVSYGALDLRGYPDGSTEIEFMILATSPAEPIGLQGAPAHLWRRLVNGPVDADSLSEDELVLVQEFVEFGIASEDVHHVARVSRVDRPRMLSPLHELVYGLTASVARDAGIRIVFIKGPALYLQGLREHEHSGDVDLWVDPDHIQELAGLMEDWGWSLQAGVWDGTHVNHSLTLEPGAWGCELDLHEHFPGVGADGHRAFEVLYKGSECWRFAAVSARVPSVTVHVVIACLHLLRPTFGNPYRKESQPRAAVLFRKAGPDAIAVAVELDAVAALHGALVMAFPEVKLPSEAELPMNWVWRGKKNRAAAYFYALRMVPWRQRLKIVKRFIWPEVEAVRVSDRVAGGSGEGSPMGLRLRRIRRGMTEAMKSGTR